MAMDKRKIRNISIVVILAVAAALSVTFAVWRANVRAEVVAEDAKMMQEVSRTPSTDDAASAKQYPANDLSSRWKQTIETLTPYIKRLTTWDSLDTYRRERNSVKQELQLADDSPLMSQFMPDVTEVEVAGRRINDIDAYGKNLEFAGLDIRASLGDTAYIADVSVKSKGKVGDVRQGSILLYVPLKDDGSIDWNHITASVPSDVGLDSEGGK